MLTNSAALRKGIILKKFTQINGKIERKLDSFNKYPLYAFVRGGVEQYFEDGVGRAAAEFAYYMFFSLFPMLIFINAAIGMLKIDPSGILNELSTVLPAQITQIIVDYFAYLSSFQSQTMLYAAVILATWSVARSISSLLHAVRKAYRVEINGILGTILSIILAALLLLSFFVLLTLMIVSKNLLDWFIGFAHLSTDLYVLWNFIQFLIGPVYICLVLASFYYAASKRKYSFRQALPGAVIACISWLVASIAFSYYVGNIYKYSALYGSLSTIMILMLWLYITGMVLILGGQLNHMLIKQKEKKSWEKR